MAKKSMIQREKKREHLIKKYSARRDAVRTQLTGISSYQDKLPLLAKLQSFPRNSAPNRHRNRCWLTGRSRSFYKDFGLSRHVLREMAHEGSIPGIKKASW